MESVEIEIPAAKRPRASGKEPCREGRLYDREAEFCVIRHDHAPFSGFGHKNETCETCTGLGVEPLGERLSPHG